MEIGKREEKLRRFIISQIEKKGPIPFCQFMEWCLYHPKYGYYQSEKVKFGKEGDYYTGPCVHPMFGSMIARQLVQMGELLGEERFDVVEMGPGSGYLCKDILDWLKKNAPIFYASIRYHLLERGIHFLREQKERLSEYLNEGKLLWMDQKTFEEGKEKLIGCIVSNELVDSFPVHRVILEKNGLKEIYVTAEGDQFKEEIGELSNPEILSYFESMGISLEEGQKAEVNLKALEWIKRAGEFLKRGFIITIDYGYLAQELFSPSRREGTLLCYYQHRVSENPYERLGEQDITSHVNFTALIKKGEEIGLHFTGLVPQYRFLIALGVFQEIESLSEGVSELDRLRLRLSLMHLIEPERGMGEIFKVLIQHKGVESPQLNGLRDLESIPWPAP